MGMKAYSKDLRIRVIDAVDRGLLPGIRSPNSSWSRLRTIKRWLYRWRETGNLAVSPRSGPPARKMGPLRTGLLPQLEAHPAATLQEHCTLWEQTTGVRVSTASMSRVITRHLGWTRKGSL